MSNSDSKGVALQELWLSLEKLSLDDSSAEESAPENNLPKSTSTEITLPADVSPAKVSPEAASPDKPATKEPAAEEPSTENSLEKVSSEETALERTPPENPAVKKPATETEKYTEWFMCPNLHDDVQNELGYVGLDYTFYPHDNEYPERRYETNIMGRFYCRTLGCRKRGWTSKLVAITIREYYGEQYNARVYNQRCGSCHRLGEPKVDETSYVERVSYRIKKWNGVDQEVPEYRKELQGREHKKDLCEGCKSGLCRGVDPAEDSDSGKDLSDSD